MIEVSREDAIKLYKNEAAIKAWQEGAEAAGKQVEAVIDTIKEIGVKATAINSKDFEEIVNKELTEEAYPNAAAETVASLRGLTGEYEAFTRALYNLNNIKDIESKLAGLTVSKGKVKLNTKKLAEITESHTAYIVKDSAEHLAWQAAEKALDALVELQENLRLSGKLGMQPNSVNMLGPFIGFPNLSDRTLKSAKINPQYFAVDARKHGRVKVV